MNEYVKLERKIHPKAVLNHPIKTSVWHYMDYWKFEKFLEKKSLYLCRADILQDKFEGTYSGAQIESINNFHRKHTDNKALKEEEIFRKNQRKKYFINCWSISEKDQDLMWKGYTNNIDGVAIKSTIERIQNNLNTNTYFHPLDLSEVNYYEQQEGKHIDYIDGFDAFINKDVYFELDKEIRILHWPNIDVSNSPKGEIMPVDLDILIDSIFLSPTFPKEKIKDVKDLIEKANLSSKPLRFSRYRREISI